MNVISLQNIEKSYGTRLLFKDVNITFTTEKRLGLVGINGTGKSTFLKILAGQMEPDKGTIERNGKASIHYLAQTPEFDADSTLLEAVLDGDHPRLRMVQSFERISREYREMQESGSEDSKISRNYMNALEQMDQQDGWQVEQQARIILTKLGFPEMDQKVAMLSGGQKLSLIHIQMCIRDSHWHDDSKMADWDMGAVREDLWKKMKFADTKPATLYVSLNGMKGSILTITEAVMKALSHKSSTKEGL